VQDVIALDSRRRLYLIQCQDRRVLLLTGGGQDVVVGWPGEHPPHTERGP
jgi:flagellar protein FliO/FliZ